MESDTPDRDPSPSGRPAWADLHLWQIQWVRDLLVLGAVLALLGLGHSLSLVSVPLLLALLFAYLVEPLVQRMTRVKRISRGLAAGAILALVSLLVVPPVLVSLGFGILQGVDFAGGIARRTGAVLASVEKPDDEALLEQVGEGFWLSLRDVIVDVRDGKGEAFEYLGIDRELAQQKIDQALRWVADNAERVALTALDTGRGALTLAVSTLASVGKFLFGVFLTAFFFFFVCSSWPSFVEFARGLVPEDRRERVALIVERMDAAIHGFVRGRLTIALVLAVFYTIGFWLMGAPAPLILGPAVSVLTLVPYAGLAAVPLVMVLLWLQGNAGLRGGIFWILLAPVVWYQIGQALDDYVLTPMIQGKSTDLDIPTILFASIAGGILMGFFGLLVAIPIAACAKILLKEVFYPRLKAWTRGQREDFLPVDRGD